MNKLGAIAPATRQQDSNLCGSANDVTVRLRSTMDCAEHLSSRIAGPYPVPALDDDAPPEGIISQLVWHMNLHRAMLERIDAALNRIDQDL